MENMDKNGHFGQNWTWTEFDIADEMENLYQNG